MKNAAVIYLSKWSEKSDTRKTLRSALARIVGVLTDKDIEPEDYPWHELRYEDVRTIGAEMADAEYKPRTINLSLSALRGVLEVAWRADMLPDDVYRKIEIIGVAGDGERAGRVLPPAEMNVLHAALANAEPLDAAVLAILAGAGVRRVELIRLRGRDFTRSTGRLAVRGKGNKHREIPVGARWIVYIERWLATLESSDALMFDLGGQDPRKAISYIVERFRLAAKLPPFSPHDLRRTFGTHVEKIGGMALAQQLLGHANINTTALYVRVDEAREAAAVKDL